MRLHDAARAAPSSCCARIASASASARNAAGVLGPKSAAWKPERYAEKSLFSTAFYETSACRLQLHRARLALALLVA